MLQMAGLNKLLRRRISPHKRFDRQFKERLGGGNFISQPPQLADFFEPEA